MIKHYYTAFGKCANDMIGNLSQKASDAPFNLLPTLEICAVNGLCTALFGMEMTDPRIRKLYAGTFELFEL